MCRQTVSSSPRQHRKYSNGPFFFFSSSRWKDRAHTSIHGDASHETSLVKFTKKAKNGIFLILISVIFWKGTQTYPTLVCIDNIW